jgi:hypothetical protein
MSHIDVFKTYEDLLASGIPESQAKAQVRALDNALERVVTKDDLKTALNSFEKEMKIFFGYLVAGSIFVTYVMPIIIALILKKLGIST